MSNDKPQFIEHLRNYNSEQFGPEPRKAVQNLLAAGLPHPWMYVYELTQNARDAGARRVCWRTEEDRVLFQHDGTDELNEDHVKSLASLGASTKGLASVGFMGIGFKSVFARYRVARVSGHGWKFGFKVGSREGDLGSSVVTWFDTLLPFWDADAPSPEDDYTTAFSLEEPFDAARSISMDLARIASLEDPTPLAVLALRGLEEVCVDSTTWRLSVEDGFVEVRNASTSSVWRWKFFVSSYRPDDLAMRRFLEVRMETHDQVDGSGLRVEREVIGLLPMGMDGLPNPPDCGRAYATLPTQVSVPFGFHIQADWLVGVDRQNLREVAGDAWQQSILAQLPFIVRDILIWLSKESREVGRRGYDCLRNPSTGNGPLADPLYELREDFQSALWEEEVVPIHCGLESASRFCSPTSVRRLPGAMHKALGSHPEWNISQIFCHEVLNENQLGRRGMAFARWLRWGRELEATDVRWMETIPAWWSGLDDQHRFEALVALWDGAADAQWDEIPVFPAEDGRWVPPTATVWLNESPPHPSEPSGECIATMLESLLPGPSERLLPKLRTHLSGLATPGTKWLKRCHREVKLAHLVAKACTAAAEPDHLPLVELAEWALSRGDERTELVPLVSTDGGALRPSQALLADPLIEGGDSRRRLFVNYSALSEDYALIGDLPSVVAFLRKLGVKGDGIAVCSTTSVDRHETDRLAKLLDIHPIDVGQANDSGYQVYDYSLPFDMPSAPPDALQDWLGREYASFRGKGRRLAKSHYHGHRTTRGKAPCSWAKQVRDAPWVECADGVRRKPSEVLLESSPDFDDAPIAVIDSGLASLLESEGIHFGGTVSKSPVLRRLALRGAKCLTDMEAAALIQEAVQGVESGSFQREEFEQALAKVRIRDDVPLHRLVERVGSGAGARSDLGGWVVSVEDLDADLTEALRSSGVQPSSTTTGAHALDFLRSVWERRPKRTDELRRHIPTAYRYILADLGAVESLATKWREVRPEVRIFAQRTWQVLDPSIAVDDVRSPLIRRFLPEHRTIATSADLGETVDQVRLVASELGLSLLSAEVSTQWGEEISEPQMTRGLDAISRLLSHLDDRNPLARVAFHSDLHVRVGDESHEVHAYVDSNVLRLAGEPAQFAAEAANQLVQHYQLGQRGGEVAWLTAALYSVKQTETLLHHLSVLAEGLGVPLSEELVDSLTAKLTSSGDAEPLGSEDQFLRPEHRRSSENSDNASKRLTTNGSDFGDDATPVRPSGSHSSDDAYNAGPSTVREASGGTDAPESKPRTPRSQATDQVRLIRMGRGEGRGGSRDDIAAREAVIAYEKLHGRSAEAMAANQPGFDVLSKDGSSGRTLRIEIKGVEGVYKGDANVLLSARQMHDALTKEDDSTEYWLYVVDSTETDSPRVFPIPWTQLKSDIKYAFYASEWSQDAKESAMVTKTGLVPLR